MGDLPRRPVAWVVAIAVNLVAGHLAIFPLESVRYFLTNYPLDALGLTEGDPTDNDGIEAHLFLLTVAALFLTLWTTVNLWIRRRWRLPARLYWPLCTVLLLGPFVLVMYFPTVAELWLGRL
ncbi:hypothetical protein ABGB17_20715 [Sphaerisporangium sp. B11E5]|uniref:hypothetical protein n=1 Tax=Sphaerisporangium sp. B11E5 TaxID=3153563 RepID=UPI00325D7CCF